MSSSAPPPSSERNFLSRLAPWATNPYWQEPCRTSPMTPPASIRRSSAYSGKKRIHSASIKNSPFSAARA